MSRHTCVQSCRTLSEDVSFVLLVGHAVMTSSHFASFVHGSTSTAERSQTTYGFFVSARYFFIIKGRSCRPHKIGVAWKEDLNPIRNQSPQLRRVSKYAAPPCQVCGGMSSHIMGRTLRKHVNTNPVPWMATTQVPRALGLATILESRGR